jgi:phosphohistidine phosphatase SixA
MIGAPENRKQSWMRQKSKRPAIDFMRAVLAIIIMAMALVPLTGQAGEEAAVVYLVRHAEKSDAGRDPQLSDAGRQRALLLANMLRDAGITRIYSTDFIRTRDTAAPLASHLDLEIGIYDRQEMNAFISSLNQAGARSLVIGHSNTTTELVELLGGVSGGKIDEASEYDRLYILTIRNPGEVETVLIRYGKH